MVYSKKRGQRYYSDRLSLVKELNNIIEVNHEGKKQTLANFKYIKFMDGHGMGTKHIIYAPDIERKKMSMFYHLK